MIAIGILGLVTIVAICAWVVFRDREAISGRALQERARSVELLASSVRTRAPRNEVTNQPSVRQPRARDRTGAAPPP